MGTYSEFNRLLNEYFTRIEYVYNDSHFEFNHHVIYVYSVTMYFYLHFNALFKSYIYLFIIHIFNSPALELLAY